MTGLFDLNLLVVFDTILSERSVTRAAARLNLSQPAVSGCLARLRDVFQDELFTRSQGEMVPTPRAVALGAPVRQVVGRIESLREFGRPFDPAQSRQTFTFSVSDFETILLAPRLLAATAKVAPLATLSFIDNANSSLPDLLTSGEVSLGIDVTQVRLDEIRSTFLMQDTPMVLAGTSNAVLAKAGLRQGDEIPLDLFCTLPHAARTINLVEDGLINRLLSAVSRTRNIRFITSHFGAMGTVVQNSDILACLPSLLAFELARHQPVTIYRLPSELGLQPYEIRLYWHRRNDDSASHQWIRGLVTTCAQELAASRPKLDLAQVQSATVLQSTG